MSSSPPPWRYETAIQEIESTIRRIESGELDLEEVVAQFQSASQTLKRCQQFLQQKQAQVDLVIEELLEEEIPEVDPEEELEF